MRKVLVAITLSFGLFACTQGNNKTSVAPGAADKDTAISDSFTVMGDRSAIEAGMKELGLRAQIETFSVSMNLHHVTYTGKGTYKQIAEKIGPQVTHIEQDFRVQLDAIEKKVEWPEDQYFFYQWALNNIGQSAPWGLPGEYDADIKLIQALNKYKSQIKEDTIVAVIDSGVDYSHEDINANMWVNEKEAKKSNGIAGQDDDGNGFCDDVHGFDFTSGGRTAPHCKRMGDPDPMDEQGHGSHCAGIIGAVADNQKGIVGVNPAVKIMALRAFGNFGGRNSDIEKAIAYAIENGANIISASYAGGNKSEIIKALIAKAGEQGILFVAAASNDGQSMELEANRKYPASYDLANILTVGATDNMDNPAVFSNYGANYVDVFAPGVGILSLAPNNGYTIMGGTSMAAPLVSGMASLIMSVYPELKKDPVRVKELIMATVDVKASMYGKVASNGRVNLLKALDSAGAATQASPLVWQEEPQNIQQMGYNTELVDIRKTITKKGAKAMRVHFDFVEVDRQFDSIYIYDKNMTLVHEIQNGSSRDLWSPVINGDKVMVRFVNAKVKKFRMGAPTQMLNSEVTECLKGGGEISDPVTPALPDQPSKKFVCLQENMDYRYEDLNKEIDDPDVFFSWKSEGFSIDKIQYTETAI